MLPDVQTQLTVIYHTLIGQYIDTACFVVAFFDWMLTFDLEVEFIWNSDWSLMKTVYLMDRFLPIVEFILAMIRDHGFLPTSSCKPMYAVSGCIYIVALYVAEYTFALRTCAIWEMNKKVIAVVTLTILGTVGYSTYNWMSSVDPLQYFAIPPLDACAAFNSKASNIYVSYILLMAYDAVVLCLMIYPTVQKYMRKNRAITRPEVMQTIYTEGILFYAYLLVLSITALVVELKVPDDIYLFSFVNRTVRPVLGCRVLLHIRELYAEKERMGSISTGVGASRIGELRFS